MLCVPSGKVRQELQRRSPSYKFPTLVRMPEIKAFRRKPWGTKIYTWYVVVVILTIVIEKVDRGHAESRYRWELDFVIINIFCFGFPSRVVFF